MQVLVAGRGVRLERNELVRAVKFYGKELLSIEDYADVKIYIDLFQKSQMKGQAGGIILPGRDEPLGLLHIRIRTTQSRQNQLITLAHEMVHLAQIVQGRFRSVRNAMGGRSVVWNKIVLTKASLDLGDMPWEQEANEMERPLYDRYENSFSK